MERVLSWLPGVKHFEGTVSIDACRRFAASGGRKTYKQVETSGTRRSPRLAKQLPHYPVVNGANYANISATRCATASPPFGARTEKERGRLVRGFLQ